MMTLLVVIIVVVVVAAVSILVAMVFAPKVNSDDAMRQAFGDIAHPESER